MPYDFKQLLTEKPDPNLMDEHTQATWAYIGQRLYANMMSERYLTAVNNACISAGDSAQPVHHIAACVRAFILSGTITR
jgi:inhibitor of KinA sporulation pathway (predicted exonuclease)